MHTLTSIIAGLLMFPLIASAATVDRSAIVKPTRREYQQSTKTPLNYKSPKERAPAITQKPYTSINNPYKFSYPSDWETYEFAKSRGVSVFPVDDEMSVSGKRLSMIGLVVTPIAHKKDYSLKEIETYFMTHATMSPETRLSDWYIPSFGFIRSEDATLLGHPAKKYVYTGEWQSKKYKAIEYITSFNNNLYVATYRAEPDYFDSDLPVFEKLLKTIKLKAGKAASSSSSSLDRAARKARSFAQSSRSSSSVRR